MQNRFLTTSQHNLAENTQVALNEPSPPDLPGTASDISVNIILAISVLIGSIGGLIRVLVPVMMRPTSSSAPSSESAKTNTAEQHQ